jgi:hypothetical protein
MATVPNAEETSPQTASSNNNRQQGQSFNIKRFREEVSSADSILPTHSFLVVFSPMPWALQKFPAAGKLDSLLTMRCDNVILPSISLLQEQSIRRYGFGPVENVAYGVNSADFTLQFIVDKEALVVQFFEAWLNTIVNRNSYGGANMNSVSQSGRRPYEVAYKDTYACSSVNVFMYDRSQNAIMEYNIYDVYPTNIQSMNMSWSEENSLMKLNVVFSFTDLQIMQSNAKNTQSAAFKDPIIVTTPGYPFSTGSGAPFSTSDKLVELTNLSNETVLQGRADGFGRQRGSVTPVPPDTFFNSPSVVLEGLPQTLDIFGNPIIIA